MGLCKSQDLPGIKNVPASILDHLPLGIIAVDSENVIRVFNRTAADIFGIIAVSIVGNKLEDVLEEQISARVQEICSQTLQTNKPQKQDVFENPPEAKSQIEISATPWKNSEGEICGVILLCARISEPQQSLSKTKLETLRNQFLATVSDEILTPITAIKSFAEIMINGEVPSEINDDEYLQIIIDESSRLTRTIKNMLDLSKIEAGMADWKMSIQRMSESIALAVDSLRALSLARKVMVTYEVPEKDPYVVADMDKLIRVVINLLTNAIRFTPEGGLITITQEILKGKRQKDTTDFVKIAIQDQGVGISREQFDVIFDKFHRIEDDLSRKSDGTGLGLSISKEIIKRLGGNIWVNSEKGQGATFYFTIPILNEPDELDAVETRANVTVVKPEENLLQRQATKLKPFGP
ncbi:MAG: ATP-binding protein [bacterium]